MKREGLKFLNLSMILSILLYFGMGYVKTNYNYMSGSGGGSEQSEDDD